MNKFGKMGEKRTKKGRNAQRNNKDGKQEGKLGQRRKKSTSGGKEDF